MKRRILNVTLLASVAAVIAIIVRAQIVGATALVSFSGIGWTTPPNFEANWTKVIAGMSQDEVRELLGNYEVSVGPVDWEKSNPPPDKTTVKTLHEQVDKAIREGRAEGLDLMLERWHYGCGVIESIGRAPPHAYVIYFSSDKKVVAFRGPREDDQ